MSKQWQHHSSTLKTTHHKVTITDTYLVSLYEMKLTTFELLAILFHVVTTMNLALGTLLYVGTLYIQLYRVSNKFPNAKRTPWGP